MLKSYPVKVRYAYKGETYEADFNLNAILLDKIEVTTEPTKTRYENGDTIDYSGMVITATYEDGSTKDVTNDCVITPADGSNYNGDDDVHIVYKEGDDEVSCEFALNESSKDNASLVISNPPDKTGYNVDETLSYEGIVVKMAFEDTHTDVDVTDICEFNPSEGATVTRAFTKSVITCVPTIEIFKEDFTNGAASGGYWAYLDPSYGIPDGYVHCDEYQVKGGHTYVIKLGDTVGNIFMAAFFQTDASLSTEEVEGVAIIDKYSNVKPYDKAIYTPSTDGYIIITKDMNYQSGIKTYVFDTDAEEKLSVDLDLLVTDVESLIIASEPAKKIYKKDEPIDYQGLVIKARYIDGHEEDVTSECEINPSEGKAFNRKTDTEVKISYEGREVTLELQADKTPTYEMTLDVYARPLKLFYESDEKVDYDGLIVNANYDYDDEAEHDVTDFCTLNPAQDTVLTPEMTKIMITCAPPLKSYVYDLHIGYLNTYGDWKYDTESPSYCDIFQVQANHEYHLFTGKNVGSHFYAGFFVADVPQAITDIEGTYIADDNAPDENKEIAVFTAPSNGYIVIDKGSDEGIANYIYDATTTEKTESTTLILSIDGSPLTPVWVEKLPNHKYYFPYENIDYAGIKVTYNYEDGTKEDITELVTFSPPQGAVMLQSEYFGVDVIYNGTTTFAPSVCFRLQYPQRLEVERPPDKYLYRHGDIIDYTGLKVNAVYTDGSKVDVTELASFSPEEGTRAYKDTKFIVTYEGLSVAINEPAVKSIDFINFVNYKSVYNADFSIAMSNTDTKLYKWTDKGYIVVPFRDEVGQMNWGAVASTSRDYVFTNIETGETQCGTLSRNYPIVSNDSRFEVYSYRMGGANFGLLRYTDRDEEGYYYAHDIFHYVSFYDSETPDVNEYLRFILMRFPSYVQDYLDYPDWLLNVTTRNLFSTALNLPSKVYFYNYNRELGIYEVVLPEYVATALRDAEIITRRIGPNYVHKNANKVRTYSGEAIPDVMYKTVWLRLDKNDGPKALLIFKIEFNDSPIVSSMLGYIEVAQEPARKYFVLGEVIDFAGISVIAHDTDGVTTTDVTPECTYTPIIANTDEELNITLTLENGETASTVWRYMRYFLDDISVKTVPTKNTYYGDDLLDYTGLEVEANYNSYYDERTTRDITDKVTITPEEGTPVTEDMSKVTVLYTYDDGETATTTFDLDIIKLNSLTVKGPLRDSYRTGETLVYIGMEVTANYSDGTTEDVTDKAVCYPADSAMATVEATKVTVSYTRGGKTVFGTFDLTIIPLESLEVDGIHKTTYKAGEELDYSGLEARAVFADGHKTGVSHKVTCSPAEGSIVTNDTTQITVQYVHDSGEIVNASVSLNVITLDSLTITDTNTYNLGDRVSYENVTVFANYSDNTSEDVSDKVTYDLAEGTVLESDTPANIVVTYKKAEGVEIIGVLRLNIN